MERLGLCLALVFIVFGAHSIIHPTEGYLLQPGPERYKSLVDHTSAPEHVTKGGARIYGFISIAVGAGLAWVAFYRPRK